MLCTLMEPMHEDYDLKQEQLNKSSLLSSERFLDGLLDMWTTHVVSDLLQKSVQDRGFFQSAKCPFLELLWIKYSETRL